MTRQIELRLFNALPNELVVDSFAGGGGASTGIEAAIGRPVDLAINHDPVAIAMHRANHPGTRHFCENIWEVDPREACAGRPVGLAWFSPDCTHFSRARGGRPCSKDIRGLAWVVIRWAEAVRPRVIIIENVEEFQTWGPLDADGRPDADRSGETFRDWLMHLTGLGYEVTFRSLVAADYGAPTTRRRLFLVARRDGARGVFPVPTHGQDRPQPWRPAAEIIDWSLPCPSIFERPRPLAEATLRRIALGIQRYVIEASEPFIMPNNTGNVPRGINQPVPTVTTGNRNYLVVPTLIQQGWGERKGQAPRVPGLGKPLGTVVGGGSKHALVAATLMIHHGASVGRPLTQPVGTVTAGGGGHQALVAAFLSKHYGGVVGHGVRRPIGTVTSRDHHALTMAFLTKFYGTAVGASAEAPLPTVTGQGGHLAEVRAFLIKYYGNGGQHQDVSDPLHTVTAKARFGLVTVHGEAYRIVDIGMRMLQPHELFAAQGFPLGYEIDPEYNGRRLTKTQQIGLAGNSVCPQVAEAVVRANVA
jgi:DNA (cytosine-5)-methyltransferase 1